MTHLDCESLSSRNVSIVVTASSSMGGMWQTLSKCWLDKLLVNPTPVPQRSHLRIPPSNQREKGSQKCTSCYSYLLDRSPALHGDQHLLVLSTSWYSVLPFMVPIKSQSTVVNSLPSSFLPACLNNRIHFQLFCRTYCLNYLLIFRMKMEYWNHLVYVWNGEGGAVTRPRKTFQKREKNKLGEIDAHLIFQVCLLQT